MIAPLKLALRPVRVLAHESRWRIIELLLRQEMCVRNLSEGMQLPQSSVSEHLQVMQQAEVVQSKRVGKTVCYRIAERFSQLVAQVRTELRITEATDPRLGADAWRAAETAD